MIGVLEEPCPSVCEPGNGPQSLGAEQGRCMRWPGRRTKVPHRIFHPYVFLCLV